MSFQKLSKEERAEWRGLPVTRAALAFVREQAMTHVGKALSSALRGEAASAAAYAGAEHALRVAADILEND